RRAVLCPHRKAPASASLFPDDNAASRQKYVPLPALMLPRMKRPLAKRAALVDDSVAIPEQFFSFGTVRRNCMRKCLFAAFFLLFCSLLIAQQAMNNDAVVKLIKAGLSDDLIVTTINSSPGDYDTSANGLIALKAAGASDRV